VQRGRLPSRSGANWPARRPQHLPCARYFGKPSRKPKAGSLAVLHCSTMPTTPGRFLCGDSQGVFSLMSDAWTADLARGATTRDPLRGRTARTDHDKTVEAEGGARGLEGSSSEVVRDTGTTGTTSSATCCTGISVANSASNCPCATNWQMRQLSAPSRRD
jgi:hypothetical protein